MPNLCQLSGSALCPFTENYNFLQFLPKIQLILTFQKRKSITYLDSLWNELFVVSRLARICNSSVTGWGAVSGTKCTGDFSLWNFVNFAKVFRFLQHKTPQRLQRHWDNSLLQHMAIRVNGKTHQVVRYVKLYNVQKARPT